LEVCVGCKNIILFFKKEVNGLRRDILRSIFMTILIFGVYLIATGIMDVTTNKNKTEKFVVNENGNAYKVVKTYWSNYHDDQNSLNKIALGIVIVVIMLLIIGSITDLF